MPHRSLLLSLAVASLWSGATACTAGSKPDTSCDDAPIGYVDRDGDGYGDPDAPVSACDGADPDVVASDGDDCDDGADDVHPAATEVCDEAGKDEDCNGLADDEDPEVTGVSTWFRDADEDGYGAVADSTVACVAPDGYVEDDDDCDDARATTNPGEQEVCGGGDEDCDGRVDDDDGGVTDAGTWYDDADGDGYGDATAEVEACDPPDGTVGDDTDCDDQDPAASPGGVEVCGDGADGDCDGTPGDCGLGAVGTISDAAAAALVRSNDDEAFGDLVVAAGDMDGDGAADWAVYEDGPKVFFGPTAGVLDTSAATALDLTSTYYGWPEDALAAADLDGDGFSDLAGGSSYSSSSGGAGRVYVWFGGPDIRATGWTEDLQIEALNFISSFGSSLATGDLDGDGIADLVASSPIDDYVLIYDGPLQAGERDGNDVVAALEVDDFSTASPDLAVGDGDGDGVDDLAVGVVAEDDRAGAVYVAEGPMRGELDAGSDTDAVFTGEEAEDLAGFSLAWGGDLDSDGYDDLVIGAVGNTEGGSDAGCVYVEYGPLGSGHALRNADVKLLGSPGSRTGYRVEWLGDVGGFGTDTLGLGMYAEDLGGEQAGMVALYYGALGGTLSSGDARDADVIIVGGASNDYLGWGLAGPGDLTGDGVDDVLVGAPGVEVSRDLNGQIYLLAGGGG